jgi:hypothetical protein
MIPAIEPLPEDARPIPLRRTDPARVAPEDAPVVLLTSRPSADGGQLPRRDQTASQAPKPPNRPIRWMPPVATSMLSTPAAKACSTR